VLPLALTSKGVVLKASLVVAVRREKLKLWKERVMVPLSEVVGMEVVKEDLPDEIPDGYVLESHNFIIKGPVEQVITYYK
jgi:hypothetical protein